MTAAEAHADDVQIDLEKTEVTRGDIVKFNITDPQGELLDIFVNFTESEGTYSLAKTINYVADNVAAKVAGGEYSDEEVTGKLTPDDLKKIQTAYGSTDDLAAKLENSLRANAPRCIEIDKGGAFERV